MNGKVARLANTKGASERPYDVVEPEVARPQQMVAIPLQNARTARRPEARSPRQKRRESGFASIVGSRWHLLAPAIVAAFVLTGLVGLTLPDSASLALGITAIAAFGLTPVFRQFERSLVMLPVARYAAMMAVVGLPMLLFGIAMANWTTSDPNLHWGTSVGILAVIGALTLVVLNQRLPAAITAKLGLWAGVAAIAGTAGDFILLAAGVACGVIAAVRQNRLDSVKAEEERQRLRNQTRAEEILNDYESTGQGWFWETDRRGTISYVSATIGAVLERDVEELPGRPFTDLFMLESDDSGSERTLTFHLSTRSSFTDLAVRAAVQGEERWWAITGRPAYDGFNNFIGFRGSGTDLTEKRRSQENATRLAHYDSLTGLSNRFQMAQSLDKILTSPRLDQRSCAIFLLDLDRFKQVNDTMGHPVGDALLKQVADRLQHTVGKYGRVGRLGGDEFEIILPGKIAREDLARLSQRIIDGLSQPYLIEDHRVTIGASVGIALSPDDGVSSEALIRNADLALYAAKDGGRGRYHFFAQDLHSDAEERRMLEQALRDAITQGSLDVHYQPVVHTVTERITGFEALLRWNHPTLGPISPAKFVPIAEDTGLIAQIGEWVLRKACADLARWPESVRVAVNVSPLQFANPALPSIVTNALAHAQVNPARLELEITESVFLNDDDGTDAMFAALKRVGVRLALDDFGTGYSSLGYLKKAPFDKIKIDQSFVRGATQPGSRNGAIISSIVSLAEALGMETTAEGVETLDELDLVRLLGCSHIQGYIYSKPLNEHATMMKLAEGLTVDAIGPRSTRATRQTVLRKVTLSHGAQTYHGTVRNLSATGTMVEGLWNVPKGTIFAINFGDGNLVTATARWCQEDRLGLEFAAPLASDQTGRLSVLAPAFEKHRELHQARG